MEVGGLQRINAREYLTALSGGIFLETWEPEADEYIIWRRPTSCPMAYLWHDQDELMTLAALDDKDPAKRAFVDERTRKMYLWTFKEWNLRLPSRDGKTPGPLIPCPTIDDDRGLKMLAPEVAGLLVLIHNHLWYAIEPTVTLAEESPETAAKLDAELENDSDEEPQGVTSLRPREGDDPNLSRRSKTPSARSEKQAG